LKTRQDSKGRSQPAPTIDEALAKVARQRYGEAATPDVLTAWRKFSDAFTEYPYHGGFLYNGPMQCGPANLLYPEPTGYRATMVGFPYDDVDGWRAVYPAGTIASQFEKISVGWREGLRSLQAADSKVQTDLQRTNLREDMTLAQAAYAHFRSADNQIRFILARNVLLSGTLKDAEREAQMDTIKKIATGELYNARALFGRTRQDPRIGYEASNHYYYLPLDLVEKVVNCRYVIDTWLPRVSARNGQ